MQTASRLRGPLLQFGPEGVNQTGPKVARRRPRLQGPRLDARLSAFSDSLEVVTPEEIKVDTASLIPCQR